MKKHSMAPGHAGDDAFVTRGELCEALAIGKTTLRRWEAEGKARPVINANGVRLYPREEAERLTGGRRVGTLPKARALVPNAGSADGELAAKIFERLDRAVHPVEIVKELSVHPDIVAGFLARWAHMRKALILTSDDLKTLAGILGLGPVGDAHELVAGVRALSKRARWRCELCDGKDPTVCERCLAAHVKGAIARVQRQLGVVPKAPARRVRRRRRPVTARRNQSRRDVKTS